MAFNKSLGVRLPEGTLSPSKFFMRGSWGARARALGDLSLILLLAPPMHSVSIGWDQVSLSLWSKIFQTKDFIHTSNADETGVAYVNWIDDASLWRNSNQSELRTVVTQFLLFARYVSNVAKRSIYTVSPKKHPRHFQLYLENQLANFNNFGHKYSWHNLPSNDRSVSTSPNVCFCTT